MSLSLNMIVRDGGQKLRRALESVCDLDCDEIIVIDTGSEDDSIQLAESYGAFVAKMEWPDNFGLVRQCALSLSDCDWVLYLDCDEWLEPETIKCIKGLMQGPKVPYVSIVSQEDGGEHWSQIRLFPREGAAWKYRVHEQILYGDNGDANLDRRLVVRHDGEIRNPDRAAYYLDLARKDLEDYPNDAHCKKQVALMMSAAKLPAEEPIRLLKEVAEEIRQKSDGDPVNFAAGMVYDTLVGLYRQEEFEALKNSLGKGCGTWSLGVKYAELCFTINLPDEVKRICDWLMERPWDGTGNEVHLRRRVEMLGQWAEWEREDMANLNRDPCSNGIKSLGVDAECRDADYCGSR